LAALLFLATVLPFDYSLGGLEPQNGPNEMTYEDGDSDKH